MGKVGLTLALLTTKLNWGFHLPKHSYWSLALHFSPRMSMILNRASPTARHACWIMGSCIWIPKIAHKPRRTLGVCWIVIKMTALTHPPCLVKLFTYDHLGSHTNRIYLVNIQWWQFLSLFRGKTAIKLHNLEAAFGDLNLRFRGHG